MKKSIAVIGAGLSGIAAIKQLTDEGHNVICFEKLDNPGGVFSHNEIYDDLHLTISNYFMAYSDFMPTNERLKFWSKADYRKYLQSYLNKFGLDDKIRYNTEVRSIKQDPDTKMWEVETATGDQVETSEFDVVAVCSGHFQHPKMPEIPGLDKFSGSVIHSKYYRDKNVYEGKRVLCVGMGESSADITSEISSVASKCILSLRRYHAVAPRFMSFQEDEYFTIDTSWLTSRIVNRLPHRFHAGITKGIFHRYINSRNPDLRIRGEWLIKSGPSFHQAVTKNERVFKPIADGLVTPHIGGIKMFDETGVTFKDGTREEIDAVVFCTGYKLEFPFLDMMISDMRDLYKQMFIPEIGQSLAFVGFARPQQGGVPAIAEMQSRYLAQLCSNKHELPSLSEQRRVIREDAQHWRDEYRITPQVASLVNYCHYMDSIAKLVGCMPKIPALWQNPGLRIKLLHGPQFAIQYRLTGPHSMPKEAENFLMNFPNISDWKRIAYLEAGDLACKILHKLPQFKIRRMTQSAFSIAGN
ncbi:hypothetical protein BTA51_24360 [Hahella sp. CCB-MM4]|uniref:flavin-containing monooxygenase n=1 Tax=Hahella sp. (strain CCB-MM4) TaxID=1926491 RepID=UPI000B9C6213|nr:NAD(P)-binding domain-containing protein [Hahella sp. CCB-MM4]OZG70723.1 hypothetical protein BTA51_24360 [Hahella sp. CCB-MM4]